MSDCRECDAGRKQAAQAHDLLAWHCMDHGVTQLAPTYSQLVVALCRTWRVRGDSHWWCGVCDADGVPLHRPAGEIPHLDGCIVVPLLADLHGAYSDTARIKPVGASDREAR